MAENYKVRFYPGSANGRTEMFTDEVAAMAAIKKEGLALDESDSLGEYLTGLYYIDEDGQETWLSNWTEE